MAVTRRGWALVRSFWAAKRRAWLGLAGGVALCALAFRLVDPALHKPESLDFLGSVPMGLSIFIVFILCTITETGPRDRSGVFPARLFTLPVSTFALVFTPMALGVMSVFTVYIIWARAVWPALGRELPLGWPLLYLAAGMVCYQAGVWSLARFPKARLVALGAGGTLFAVGWTILRDDFASTAQFWWGPEMPWRTSWCSLLWLLLGAALGLAVASVEAQRRGGWTTTVWRAWRAPRSFQEIAALLEARRRPRRPLHLTSAPAAQLWLEWRRHGILLPLTTLGVLIVIMAPAAWFEPLSAETTASTVGWIVLLPLLLAFAFGQGFGKADLWSKSPGMSLFFATRPLSTEDRMSAKFKAGLLAAIASWLIVMILTPLWICWWGDWHVLAQLWDVAKALYPVPTVWILPALVLASAILLTWRLLVGSLYVGFLGQNWLLVMATCSVFVGVLGGPLLVLALNQQPELARKLWRVPSWVPWVLGAAFSVKVGVAFALTIWALRRRWISARAVNWYVKAWVGVTAVLFITAWLLAPVQGWTQWSLAWLALMAMPMLRAAYAPVALARSRRG